MIQRAEVTVEKLVYGGAGLARLENGKTVFVSGALPGELVAIDITRKRKGVYEAVPVEIKSPSKDRITPPCSGEKECAGATWSHISYPAQLLYKEEILLDALERIGGIRPRRPLRMIPSPKTDHYRLRAQFTVRPGDKRQMIGFFRRGTYELIEVENAFLLHPLINKILSGIRRLIDGLPPLREIHVNAGPRNEAHILLFGEQEPFPEMEPFFNSLKKIAPEVVGMAGYLKKKKAFSLGRGHLTLEVEGAAFRATEGNFFQVNWDQNRNMVKTVLDFAGLAGHEAVLDLYCGIGNFTLPLARRAGKVIGVESGFSAVEDARWSAEANGIRNVEFIADVMEKGLKSLILRKMRSDVIVLDPPRAGATLKTLERVLAFVPQKIIYVSCNPATLARDLKHFHLFGFRLDRLQPIDMFPYTYHIECVAEMVREG